MEKLKNLSKVGILFLLIIFSFELKAIKLSEIKGMNLLENYSSIKDIEVNRIVDYENYDRNK